MDEKEECARPMVTKYTPGTQLDHYEVVKMLGHGGMNRVYLATDVHTGQQVVLKIPNDDIIGDIATFERYRREAEIGNRINHPNVQHLLNTEEERSEHYLVVEFIKGRTLRAVLEELSPNLMPREEALRITMQIADALAYCHEHGVYHRDIKPENIMIQEDGNVKIIDFGIALLQGARRVTWRGFSGTVGTPDYMSPEQLRGERGTASSDIYGVGIMLYEMLCGRTPFEGENIFAIMNQHVSQDPPSILECNPDIPAELATVVMHAIRRDPEKRYKTMLGMLHDLQNLPSVKPVDYHPDLPQKDGVLMRQLKVAALVIICICLIIIAFGFLAQFAHHALR